MDKESITIDSINKVLDFIDNNPKYEHLYNELANLTNDIESGETVQKQSYLECNPGEEKYEQYCSDSTKKTYYTYEYCSYWGKFFTCDDESIEKCRIKRNEWLNKKEREKAIADYYGAKLY
jgi:hypothetical protein